MSSHARLLRVLAFVLASVFAACAFAQPAKTHRVGVVFFRIPISDLEGMTPRFPGAVVLRQSLSAHGWIPGKNLEILWRSAEGDEGRLDAIIEELVGMPVDVLMVSGNEITRAAMRRTKTIPIVMIVSTQPVENGLVASLARPGGNVTGLVFEAANLNAKRLALLKEAVPGVRRVAFLHDRNFPISGGTETETADAARKLGLTLHPYVVNTHKDLEDAIAKAVREGVNGVVVDTSLAAAEKDQPAFHAIAQRHGLPMMHTYLNAVTNGGLMYYGVSGGELYRRSAYLVDRLLRGGKAAEMPVESPRSYELIINLKAAKALGLKIPAGLVSRADKLIE